MRSLLLLITLIFCTAAYTQSIEDKLFNKICECLTIATKQKKVINDEKFQACVDSDSVLNKELEDHLATNDSLAAIDPYEFGREFFNKNQVRLIHECDAWFHLVDSMRYDFLKEIDKKYEQIQIDSLTMLISVSPGKSQLYEQRGLSYFMLFKTVEAKADFDKALSLPEANSRSLYFRGWIAEINGNYDEAIKDYELAKKSNDDAFLETLMAIAERKKKEKK